MAATYERIELHVKHTVMHCIVNRRSERESQFFTEQRKHH
jgi:hypothetical protein